MKKCNNCKNAYEQGKRDEMEEAINCFELWYDIAIKTGAIVLATEIKKQIEHMQNWLNKN